MNKTNRKLLTLLAALAILCVSAMPLSAQRSSGGQRTQPAPPPAPAAQNAPAGATQAESPASDFQFTVSGGKVTITGYTGSGGAVVIPATINGLPVTEIGTSAFSARSDNTKYSITRVVIPSGVIEIGDGAFENCKNLTNVTIPSTVTSIGGAAFHLTGLTSVTIPNSVTFIGSFAFARTMISSVTIPGSITEIYGNAFGYCHELREVVIEEGVARIGMWAFLQCSSLEKVTLPASINKILTGPFVYCDGIVRISIAGTLSKDQFDNMSGTSNLWNDLYEAYSRGGPGVYTRSNFHSKEWTRVSDIITVKNAQPELRKDFVTNNTNLYADHSLNAKVIKTIKKDEIVTVLENWITDSAGKQWAHVEHGGSSGWVLGEHLLGK